MTADDLLDHLRGMEEEGGGEHDAERIGIGG
jgi:hypothetical protein